jgi:hypothetical protein
MSGAVLSVVDDVAVVRLNRPRHGNALSKAVNPGCCRRCGRPSTTARCVPWCGSRLALPALVVQHLILHGAAPGEAWIRERIVP